ncbi:MAG: sodium:proton antiporter [Chloroflexi bacterium]|nr:sodium:proton antiporter [Chloroflexota bacterium]
MIQKHESIVIQVVARALVPLILLFGVYVIVFGHYGPGGGFQGGVILATGVILHRLCLGRDFSHRTLPPGLAGGAAIAGLLLFGLMGIVPMVFGGAFLDYAHLPLPGYSTVDLRYLGIGIVEVAIGLAVMGASVVIFDSLAGGDSDA